MGTYYEIVCLDCDKRGGIYADRAPSCAEQALSLAKGFLDLSNVLGDALIACGERWYDLEVRIGGNRIDLQFFHRHGDHNLRVIDGYGGILGECRYFLLGDGVCRLREGHEGPCRKA